MVGWFPDPLQVLKAKGRAESFTYNHCTFPHKICHYVTYDTEYNKWCRKHWIFYIKSSIHILWHRHFSWIFFLTIDGWIHGYGYKKASSTTQGEHVEDLFYAPSSSLAFSQYSYLRLGQHIAWIDWSQRVIPSTYKGTTHQAFSEGNSHEIPCKMTCKWQVAKCRVKMENKTRWLLSLSTSSI